MVLECDLDHLCAIGGEMASDSGAVLLQRLSSVACVFFSAPGPQPFNWNASKDPYDLLLIVVFILLSVFHPLLVPLLLPLLFFLLSITLLLVRHLFDLH